MQSLALVPARVGSRGIPGKNLRSFAGRPLLAWSVDVGLETCTRTVVSSDSTDILQVGLLAGAQTIKRPELLAQDDTSMAPVIRHALDVLLPWKPDVMVLLQPTSPLRTPRMVQDALSILEADKERNVDSVTSVVPIPAHWSPDLLMTWNGNWLKAQRPQIRRRQQARQFYCRDGSVYAIRHRILKGGALLGTHCTPLILSPAESVTLDEESDWKKAEAIFEARHMARKVSA